jgi:hypothetical protein
MKRGLLVAALALAACGREGAAPVPAGAGAEGEAVRRYVEVLGVWAQRGACGDRDAEWAIDESAFGLGAMNCSVETLETTGEGVRAGARCDGRALEHVEFVRENDATLTIFLESSRAMYSGLERCSVEL